MPGGVPRDARGRGRATGDGGQEGECRCGREGTLGTLAHHDTNDNAGRPSGTARVEVRGGCAQALKLDPQPQVVVAFGLLNTKPRPMISSLKSIVVPFRYR